MVHLPLCRLVASGIDVSSIRAFTDEVHATTGARFADGSFYQFDLPTKRWHQFAAIISDCIAPHVGRPVMGFLNLLRLAPGADVAEHIDWHMTGIEEQFPIQLHVVVSAAPGCEFTIAGETIAHSEGDIWQVSGTSKLPHHASNRSDRERLIIRLNVAV